MPSTEQLRQLGTSELRVSPVALGTWPMAGQTTLDVNDDDSIATIRSCLEHGVNFIDTAYCYGLNGECENLVRRAIAAERDQFVIATKCGAHYNDAEKQVLDARPETIRRQCEESLRRLGTNRIDLYYLHFPDPAVPIADSAGAIADLIAAGKVRTAGASNCCLDELQKFHAVCPLTAVQLPYNMLQRGIEQQTLPWCQEQQVSVIVYWALMKGLLAGRLGGDAPLDPRDNRLNYPMFQGDEWQRNQVLVDELRAVAGHAGKTVAQLVINWTIQQPGIAVALCGAKRAWQFAEVAGAMGWRLSDEQLRRIEEALAARGPAVTNRNFA